MRHCGEILSCAFFSPRNISYAREACRFTHHLALALVLLLACWNVDSVVEAAHSQASESVTIKRDVNTDVSPFVEAHDADSNGRLSKSEARGVEGLREAFDSVDENKDGELDAEELSEFFARAAGTMNDASKPSR